MSILKKPFFYIALTTVLLIGLIVFYSANFLIDLWWFETLGLGYYYALRETYRDLLLLFVTIVISSIIYINFVIIPKLLPVHLVDGTQSDQHNYRSGPFKLLSSHSKLVFLSIILSIPVLIPVYNDWESFLLFFFSSPSGIKDPAYARDISFYLFSFPVFKLIQEELMLTFLMLFGVVSFYYWLGYKKYESSISSFPSGPKIHLTVLIVIIVLTEAWSISFARIELLYVNRHVPIFFGPGFIEMTYELPLIWLTFFIFLGTAVSAVYFVHTRKGIRLTAGLLVVYFILIGFRLISLIPGWIERFYVQPNPVVAEKKYIQFNIDATLEAFDLADVEKIDYPVISSLTRDVSTEIFEELDNIPIWEHGLLEDVYDQLQAIRPFFQFTSVAVDRYRLSGIENQVNIAARELTLDKMPKEARNWQNRHLTYTHGYGAVVTPASQQGGRPMEWYLSELSLNTRHNQFKIKRPEIFYGLADYEYAIVPNNAPVSGGIEMNTNYQGSGGLKMSSLMLRMILSAYLADEKMLFSTSVNNRSRVLILRNIKERIETIAPFLKQDSSPYPVIVDQKIYWIIDAYTTSDLYPVVQPVDSPFVEHDPEEEPETINYVRNSIKIIVDAYNGSVDFYIVDPDDPIVSAYKSAYPTLFKSMSDMPKQFIRHLSYPQDLFLLQMQIYARYHQTDPNVFYQQSQALQFATMEGNVMIPYYLTIDILDKPGRRESEHEKFVLVNPYSPIGRDNLNSIVLAGCLDVENCNDEYIADIYFYAFPENVQVDGPEQVNALIEQNPEISSLFSLWDQRGSKVIRGRMLIIPIEKSILYIQPIYLVSSATTSFPQLARIIVSMNQETAMGNSVESAYKQLEQKLSGLLPGKDNIVISGE